MKINRENLYWQEGKADCEFFGNTVRNILRASNEGFMKPIFSEKGDLKK